MKSRFRIIILAVILIMLTAGCGKKEERQLGVDGYVYIPEELQWNVSNNIDKFCESGDFLYYLRYMDPMSVIERLSVDTIRTGNEIFGGEKVITASDIFSGAPEEIKELRKGKDSVDIWDYTVDSEQNLYCLVALYETEGFNRVPAGGILCKYSADGQPIYWLGLPEAKLHMGEDDILAADDRGGVCLLIGENILSVDATGRQTGKLSIEETVEDARRYLMEGAGGQIYYMADSHMYAEKKTFLVNAAENKLQQADALTGQDFFKLYEALDSLLVQEPDGTLSRYDSSRNSLDEILNWEDSDLYAGEIWEIVQLTEEHFLILSGMEERTYYLCTKTSVEELPEKELLVVASLFPDSELQKAVTEFNRASEEYHLSIESYGAILGAGDLNEGAYIRLDSSLVSKDVPDILDMTQLDIAKYMGNGVLEDLYPYMDEEEIFNRANYLDNLLESYTMDGKLACIPKNFYLRSVFGAGDRMASIEEWTMPELMRLTEEYPEAGLFNIWQRGRSYLVQNFCSDYYLEQFVDWENGFSSFDSQEFCDLLCWINEQGDDYINAEDHLMTDTYLYGFFDYVRLLLENEEALYLLGNPSADGQGSFQAIAENALGIAAKSRHKEGAWEFVKYYLSREGDYDKSSCRFTTRKDLLAERCEYALTPEYILNSKGEHFIDKNGNESMTEKMTFNINGVYVPCYYLEQEQVDTVMEIINRLDFTPRSSRENSIISIVLEEAESFFNGDKPVEEAAGVIQNRVQLLLQENG